MHIRMRSLPLTFVLVLLAAGCADEAPSLGLAKAYPKDGIVQPPAYEGREPGELATVRGEPVVGRTGPDGREFEVALRSRADGGHLVRRFGTRTLPLGAREQETALPQYPCTSCHESDGRLTAGAHAAGAAHQNITAVHPQATGATCTACHASEDVSRLRLGTGELTGLDHTYRLCAECHAPQVDDWAAGAHGKRLDGWQGRRVVMGCTDCHDPHRPALTTRVPFPPPVLRGGGQRQP